MAPQRAGGMAFGAAANSASYHAFTDAIATGTPGSSDVATFREMTPQSLRRAKVISAAVSGGAKECSGTAEALDGPACDVAGYEPHTSFSA